MHGCGTAKTHAQARRPYPNSNIFFILHTFRRPTIHVSRPQISKKRQSLQSHTCQIPMRPKFLYTNAIRANTRLDQRGETAGLHSQAPYLLSLLHHGVGQPAAVTSHRRRHGIGIAPASTQEGDCPAFASWPEGWPWSCGPPGGGQLLGGICVSFPGVCRTVVSGLR